MLLMSNGIKMLLREYAMKEYAHNLISSWIMCW
jgi:hypothetical protein